MSNQQAFEVPIGRFGQSPPEGFGAVPLTYLFDGGATQPTTYKGDYVLGQARGFFTQVRTVFVDNSLNASPVVLLWDSGQALNVAAYSQGYYPVLSPGDIKFSVSSAGGAAGAPIVVTVFLINILLPCTVWSVRGLPITVTTSGSGDQATPPFRANFAATGQVTNTQANIVVGAPGYFIQGLDLWLSPDAILAAAGDLTISLDDSNSGRIWQTIAYLPAIAPGPLTATALRLGLPAGWLWTAKAAASGLSLTLNHALTGGALAYTLNYGLTTFIG